MRVTNMMIGRYDRSSIVAGTFAYAYRNYYSHRYEFRRLCRTINGVYWSLGAANRKIHSSLCNYIDRDQPMTVDALTWSLENVRAAEEKGVYKGLLNQDHLNLLIERWGNRPDISDVLTEMRQTINDDGNEIENDEYDSKFNNMKDRIDEYTSFLERMSDAMDVLVFWDSLYVNLGQLADKFEEVIENSEGYTEKDWKRAHEDICRGGAQLTEDYRDAAHNTWTCTGFDFEKEKKVMESYRQVPNLREMLLHCNWAMWQEIPWCRDDKTMLAFIKQNQPELRQLFENLEKVVRPTFPVKVANPESRSGGGGGGGGKAAEIIRNATTIQRAMRGKKGRKAAAEAKAEAEAEAEAAAAAPTATPDPLAANAAHITRQRERDGLLPGKGSDNEKQQPGSNVTKR